MPSRSGSTAGSLKPTAARASTNWSPCRVPRICAFTPRPSVSFICSLRRPSAPSGPITRSKRSGSTSAGRFASGAGRSSASPASCDSTVMVVGRARPATTLACQPVLPLTYLRHGSVSPAGSPAACAVPLALTVMTPSRVDTGLREFEAAGHLIERRQLLAQADLVAQELVGARDLHIVQAPDRDVEPQVEPPVARGADAAREAVHHAAHRARVDVAQEG